MYALVASCPSKLWAVVVIWEDGSGSASHVGQRGEISCEMLDAGRLRQSNDGCRLRANCF